MPRWRVITLIALCWFGAPAHSQVSDVSEGEEHFTVQSAQTTLVEGVYLLDARIDYDFTPDVLEALDSGVPLTLAVQMEIVQTDSWLWDTEFAAVEQRYRLEYHALTEQYRITHLSSGAQYNFPSRATAISALGNISNFPLLDKKLLIPSEEYSGRMQASLDVETLPTPLRLLAYFSSEWDLTSDWYTWPLQP